MYCIEQPMFVSGHQKFWSKAVLEFEHTADNQKLETMF